jgi:high affinity Mn2+ porin
MGRCERLRAGALCAVLTLAAGAARAKDAPDGTGASPIWALHGQATLTWQGHPSFTSPYVGPNSLNASTNGRETFDATLYAGLHPWAGGEIWINPEIDQGFGLSNTLGVAGFPSGEAYKVGRAAPYTRLPRLFLRQTIDLGGERQKVAADLNQFAGSRTGDRLVLTIGKFAVTDVFDANSLAHDPKNDFLNWSLIDTGTFDYAANAWGYTVGAAAEWYRGPWTLRLGAFALSDVPNSTTIDSSLDQFQLVGEIERRYRIGGRDGALRITAFDSRGRMGSFADALALARTNGEPANTALVRRYQGRPGVSLNLEQKLTSDLGLFARAGMADGNIEPYEFTDVDRTAALGLSLAGSAWGRKDDTFALAGVVNRITSVHQAYLAGGGVGILVGDGRLPHPGPEQILETYYSLKLNRFAHLSIDYQYIDNPAYNRDRGPVSVFGVRLHGQF